MAEKPTDDSPNSTPPQPSKTFKPFQRRQRTERTQGGRVLPPAPAWMQKPLKPPGVRNRTSDNNNDD
jgi:hypothetical protein